MPCVWPRIVWLRDIGLCARLMAGGAVFPHVVHRLRAAGEQLSILDPTAFQNIAQAASHLAGCLLAPAEARVHLFEARIALRAQRALHSGRPVPRLPTTGPLEEA